MRATLDHHVPLDLRRNALHVLQGRHGQHLIVFDADQADRLGEYGFERYSPEYALALAAFSTAPPLRLTVGSR